MDEHSHYILNIGKINGVGSLSFCDCGYIMSIEDPPNEHNTVIRNFKLLKEALNVKLSTNLLGVLVDHNDSVYESRTVERRVKNMMFETGHWVTK